MTDTTIDICNQNDAQIAEVMTEQREVYRTRLEELASDGLTKEEALEAMRNLPGTPEESPSIDFGLAVLAQLGELDRSIAIEDAMDHLVSGQLAFTADLPLLRDQACGLAI